MAGPRIGIFGGSFDPVHVGHLVAACGVRHDLELDRVLMVVANEPWQKTGDRDVGQAELRFRMVEAAVAGHDGLEASRIEIDRGGPSYTVDTLRVLQQDDPSAELFLIMGMDTAANLETWANWQDVAILCHLVVVNRPGGELPVFDPVWRVSEVIVPAMDVSSTDLRRRLTDGRPLDFLIPDKALRLLAAEGLYPGLQEK